MYQKAAQLILAQLWFDFKRHGFAAVSAWIGAEVFDYGYASLVLDFQSLGAIQDVGCSADSGFYSCSTDNSLEVSLPEGSVS